MTTEAEGDIDPLWGLNVDFNSGYVSNVMCETVDKIQNDIDYRLHRITKLLLDIPMLHFSDPQRRMTERELLLLQTEIDVLTHELRNTLVMAPDLGYPIAIRT